MKEIEIKARLHDRAAVMKKLESLGCVFENAMTQNDVVYVRNVGSLEKFRGNDAFLRIRVKNNSKILFTVKKPMANDLDALEYEVEVSSASTLEQALLLMGYKEAVRINKTRIVTQYDGCEICIDEVEDLGSFIEMEKLAEEGDSEEIQTELFEFFKTLGITNEDRVFLGYDSLILTKNA
jgi:adenylate cyclase class 2